MKKTNTNVTNNKTTNTTNNEGSTNTMKKDNSMFTRCYIMCKEDLLQSKKMKKLFSSLYLEEIAPTGSGLPKIDGMHYYMTEILSKQEPVTKKSLDLIGSSIEEYEQNANDDLDFPQPKPWHMFPVQDDIDKIPLEEMVAELSKDKKAKQSEQKPAPKKKVWEDDCDEDCDDDVDYGDAEDLSFEEILAVIGCRAPEKEDAPADDKDTALEEVIADLGGMLIKPAPRPTQEEVNANPEAFISIDRKVLAPYFGEDCPAEYVEMVILTLLAMNRMRELEAEAHEKNTK